MTNYKRNKCDGNCGERIDNQTDLIAKLKEENAILRKERTEAHVEAAEYKQRFETMAAINEGQRSKMHQVHANYTRSDANWDGGYREGMR